MKLTPIDYIKNLPWTWIWFNCTVCCVMQDDHWIGHGLFWRLCIALLYVSIVAFAMAIVSTVAWAFTPGEGVAR